MAPPPPPACPTTHSSRLRTPAAAGRMQAMVTKRSKPGIGRVRFASGMRSSRLITTLLLFAALLFQSAAPVRAGWTCPDGTACLPDSGAVRCAMVERSEPDCCSRPRARSCRHGAPAGDRSDSAGISSPGQCRFQISGTACSAVLLRASRTETAGAEMAPGLLPLQPAAVRLLSLAEFFPLRTAGLTPSYGSLSGPSRAPPAAG